MNKRTRFAKTDDCLADATVCPIGPIADQSIIFEVGTTGSLPTSASWSGALAMEADDCPAGATVALLVLLCALLGRLTFSRSLVRLTSNRFLVRLAPLALRQPRILQCDLLGRARRRKLARQLWAIIDDGEIRCLERQNYREFLFLVGRFRFLMKDRRPLEARPPQLEKREGELNRRRRDSEE